MLAAVCATAALVGIALAVEADDVEPSRAALRLYREASLSSFHVAIADGEVLPCSEFHDLGGDAQGNGALDLGQCFGGSLAGAVVHCCVLVSQVFASPFLGHS